MMWEGRGGPFLICSFSSSFLSNIVTSSRRFRMSFLFVLFRSFFSLLSLRSKAFQYKTTRSLDEFNSNIKACYETLITPPHIFESRDVQVIGDYN